MDTHEQWNLTLCPAKYLLHLRSGTHADLAWRLITSDLNKTRQRRLTLLKLTLVAFSALSEQFGRDMMDAKVGPYALAMEWITGCTAEVMSRLSDDALDLWHLCGKHFMMKEQEKRAGVSTLVASSVA